MENRGFKVRALGEIAIRCRDKKAMMKFYGEVIGLEHLAGDVDDRVTFFRIAEFNCSTGLDGVEFLPVIQMETR